LNIVFLSFARMFSLSHAFIVDRVLIGSGLSFAASSAERDSMGEMYLPAEAYYGAQTARAVESRSRSTPPPPTLPWVYWRKKPPEPSSRRRRK
jgi:hypothetical protein